MPKKVSKEVSKSIDDKKGHSDKKLKIFSALLSTLIIVLIALGAVGYIKYNDLKKENARLSNPEESAKTELENLKKKISTLVDVPTDEEPTIATVTDTTKLKDQPFFVKAENGDKVFMYQKAKKAILYRPSTNKIIEVAPITDGKTPDKADGVKSTDPTSSNSTSTTPTNGTETTSTPTQP